MESKIDNVKKEKESQAEKLEEQQATSKNEKINSPKNEEVLRDSYTLDEMSDSSFDDNIESQSISKVNIPKKLTINAKDKEFFEFIQAVIKDQLSVAEKILNSSKSHNIVNRTTYEGMLPVHYAVLNGSLNCFEFLVKKKAQLDKDVEGLHLIHLSLVKSIFTNSRKKCAAMFEYIHKNFPEQKKKQDRLGRTYMHMIFEYDFDEALKNIDFDFNDLFVKDYNSQYALSYCYLYKSHKTFYKISKDQKFLQELYLTIREKYNEDGPDELIKGKEKFLEMCFLYQNFDVIIFLILNSNNFSEQLKEDLYVLDKNYSNSAREYQLKNSLTDIDEKIIDQVVNNIRYAIRFFDSQRTVDPNERSKYEFPCKLNGVTGIVFNRDCIKHVQLPDDFVKHMIKRNEMFENSDRLACLVDPENGIILNDAIFNFNQVNQNTKNRFHFHESSRKADFLDILKCHSINYLKSLKEKCMTYKHDNSHNNAKAGNKDIKFSLNAMKRDSPPSSIKIGRKTNNSSNHAGHNEDNTYNYNKLDCDTFFNQYTYENIFNTAGCVFDAVDLVMSGKCKNSFALIRPPGHHAGFYGPVENPIVDSAGFCIVNNVAIAAAYTLYKYKDQVKKIAIFDFDVHHGNGTEEIIQMLSGKKFERSFNYNKIGSIKIEDDKQISWLNLEDAKNILFISTHIYNEQNPKAFYPYTGSEETNTKEDDPIYPGGIKNIAFPPKQNFPPDYKSVFRRKVIPRLNKFCPDFIFLSAGFDGHELEIINRKHMNLRENDFAYITQQVQYVAHKFCGDRLVSILEGGYNVTTGIISSFAQSVFTHARYLNISVNMFHCFDAKMTGTKRKIERENELKNYMATRKTRNQRRSERIKNQDKQHDEEKKEESKEIISASGSAEEKSKKNNAMKIEEEAEEQANNENMSESSEEKEEPYDMKKKNDYATMQHATVEDNLIKDNHMKDIEDDFKKIEACKK